MDRVLGGTFFSTTYAEARCRFLAAASEAGATLASYPIECPSERQSERQSELAIDVAVLGADDAPLTVVVSSGVHGVEGFVGSAIQLAWLQRIATKASQRRVRYVLIHAVNPFGFAHCRRFNEDNVDLNRNFRLPGLPYAGSPTDYARLDAFLNPPSPPSSWEPFKLMAMLYLVRFGRQSLTRAIAAGQYDFPSGVFFGGHGPCRSTSVIQTHLAQWLGGSQSIVHVDLHTGLGAFGEYKLLLESEDDSVHVARSRKLFGPDVVQSSSVNGVAPYSASGGMGVWLEDHFRDRQYLFVTAEFGTFDSVRVFAAIRAENRAHHYAAPQSRSFAAAKRELLECFCPRDGRWRQAVIAAGVEVIERAGGD